MTSLLQLGAQLGVVESEKKLKRLLERAADLVDFGAGRRVRAHARFVALAIVVHVAAVGRRRLFDLQSRTPRSPAERDADLSHDVVQGVAGLQVPNRM